MPCCVLVAGIPASGKSVLAGKLGVILGLPVISKDEIKERLYDTVGFRSRQEKAALGMASMEIMYYAAERFMRAGRSLILENNFEDASMPGLIALMERTSCTAVTLLLTGDCSVLYRRFLERNRSPLRHRGHVVNDCYPERPGDHRPVPDIPYDAFLAGIKGRGMDRFQPGGPLLTVDTTDLSKIDPSSIAEWILSAAREEIVEKTRDGQGENGL